MVSPNFCSKCETTYSGSKDKCPNCTPDSIIAEDIALEADAEDVLPVVENLWALNINKEEIKEWKERVKNNTEHPNHFNYEIREEKNGWSQVDITRRPLDKDKMEIINALVKSGVERVSFKRRDREKASLVTLTIRGERVVEVRPA